MKIGWRTEWPHWLLLAAMFAGAALAWSSAPSSVPVHWGLAGEPDRWGGRPEALLPPPLIALALYLLLLFLPRIDPGRASYERFAGAYSVLRFGVLALVAAAFGLLLLGLRGLRVNPVAALPVLLGAFLILAGSVLSRIEPNWFVGVRTPWTLSSRRSWDRTHRAGGPVMIGIGLAILAAALAPPPWSLVATFVLIIAFAVWAMVYSYLVWRGDPDKVSPGDHGHRPRFG